MEVNSLFLITKAKLPARVLHQSSIHQEKKKMNIIFVQCIGSKLLLVQVYFLYQGMERTMKMSFYKTKKI